MKTYKKVFACTLAAGIVLCAAGFAMANFDVRGLDKGGRYETRQYSASEPVSSVRILAQNAGIRVEKSEGGIQIEYSENKLYRYEVSLEGGVLSLSAIPTKWYQNLINFSSVSVPPVTLRLDETAYEEIFLKTDNGDISSALSLSAETLSVSTDNGNIDFAGADVSGDAQFSSNNGNIRLSGISCTGKLTAESDQRRYRGEGCFRLGGNIRLGAGKYPPRGPGRGRFRPPFHRARGYPRLPLRRRFRLFRPRKHRTRKLQSDKFRRRRKDAYRHDRPRRHRNFLPRLTTKNSCRTQCPADFSYISFAALGRSRGFSGLDDDAHKAVFER